MEEINSWIESGTRHFWDPLRSRRTISLLGLDSSETSETARVTTCGNGQIHRFGLPATSEFEIGKPSSLYEIYYVATLHTCLPGSKSRFRQARRERCQNASLNSRVCE